MTPSTLHQTPLTAAHTALAARMGPFAGYAMPIQYAGIIAEHRAARRGVAIFDTCHMGEFEVSGPAAAADLDALVTCNVTGMRNGRCRYGLLCNETGGVKDDLILYRHGRDRFMVVVNAGTRAGDYAWIASHLSDNTAIEDRSDDTAKIDIQGPRAAEVVDTMLADDLGHMRYFAFRTGRMCDVDVLLSRTGYTGELGFEIYAPADAAPALWNTACDLGAVPAGLGARDTLRLETGLPLYGHELSEDRNAAEAGFDWAIAAEKPFVGADAIRGNQATPSRRLVGLRLSGRRAARAGDAVCDAGSGDRIGTVTSGAFGPSVGHAIALAYVDTARAATGTDRVVRTARTELPCNVSDLPFYTRGTARVSLQASGSG